LGGVYFGDIAEWGGDVVALEDKNRTMDGGSAIGNERRMLRVFVV
jgi:hypothetical protein